MAEAKNLPQPEIRRWQMAIAVTYNPPAMTSEQYDQIVSSLDSAGAYPASGRLYHVCFGDKVNLKCGEVWESQEAFDKWGETIKPLFEELGVDAGQPEIAEVHNILA
jgi:hypothetical protein